MIFLTIGEPARPRIDQDRLLDDVEGYSQLINRIVRNWYAARHQSAYTVNRPSRESVALAALREWISQAP